MEFDFRFDLLHSDSKQYVHIYLSVYDAIFAAAHPGTRSLCKRLSGGHGSESIHRSDQRRVIDHDLNSQYLARLLLKPF